MTTISQWTVFETCLTSSRAHANPLWDVDARVVFRGPDGREFTIDAFWDGGRNWRVRFSPEQLGGWTWRSLCVADADLDGRQGAFECVAYQGDNPLYQRGSLRLSADRTHFIHADGSPFFWLGDTAWNGVLRAADADWDHYLQLRRQQSFSVIQFVSTQWRGCDGSALPDLAYTGDRRIQLNPAFFQRLDAKVAAINAHGLVGSPIVLWAIWPDDPGRALWEEDAARLARYIVSRWGAYHMVWMLAGDGDYTQQRTDRWKRIGRHCFADRERGQFRLVTLHPCGRNWCADDFRNEAWFDFAGIQSGHGDTTEHLEWLVFGPPATKLAGSPPLPLINLEPNYEAHPAYQTGNIHGDYNVRRASYWSLLLAPPAGVTFGHNAIWPWNPAPADVIGHRSLFCGPWSEGLETPGTHSMSILHRFFAGLPWWQLRPTQDLLLANPGRHNVRHFIAAAAALEGDLAVVYLPVGGSVELRTGLLESACRGRWFNPRDGSWTDAGPVTCPTQKFTAPDAGDWLVVIEPQAKAKAND